MKSIYSDAYDGKTVLVTGHTGFMGSWLIEVLSLMNAKVIGFSLDPPTTPNMYEITGLDKKVTWIRGDVRDFLKLKETVAKFSPDFVFHLAAQSLVLHSYDAPVETFEVNVMGTVNLLESLRNEKNTKSVVVVTSDKSYKNRGWDYPYREIDELGGRDPYSASKSCADIVVNSFRESFFRDNGMGLSSVRAGNIIGGGDFGENRLIPDMIRSLMKSEPLRIRNPDSVRPWQHVLDAINGMLKLSQMMYENPLKYSGDWNFGPLNSSVTVKELMDMCVQKLGRGNYFIESNSMSFEEKTLKLDVNKAMEHLHWKPMWNIESVVRKALDWYIAHLGHANMSKFTISQIHEYYREV